MKSRIGLLEAILDDYRTYWSLPITLSDSEYAKRRYAEEGYAFLASVLPSLDDALLKGLSSGVLPDFVGWRMDGSKPWPKFLSGLWARVFMTNGALRVIPCTRSIRAIRQISRAFKKVFEVCADSKVEAAMASFVSTDRELSQLGEISSDYNRVCRTLFQELLANPHLWEAEPAHGPGAVAERLDSVGRWDFPAIPSSLLRWFDLSDFFPKYREEYGDRIGPAFGRVVAVPKTFDKPRLISIEPSACQYAQQSFLRSLDRRMCRFPSLNMRDQSRNKSLARVGSVDGSLATIDLSEASDRVSMKLVRALFRRMPLLSVLEDLRTPAVYSISGELIPLNKFASMGSALTFPVQMLVFMTIVCTGIARAEGRLHDKRFIRSLLHHPGVGVYGDDIIIPTRYWEPVTDGLRECGLRINEAKSYNTGPFRESCGGDYVGGVDVTPLYVRRQPPQCRRDVDNIVSWADMAHALAERDLPAAASFAASVVTRVLPGLTCTGPGTISLPGTEPRKRYNRKLQRQEALARVVSPRRHTVSAGDDAVLAKALASVKGSYTGLLSNIPEHDPLALTHHGRPSGAFITRRWVPAE